MGRDRRDLRPVRVHRPRGSRDRGRPDQLPDAEHPARPSRPGPVGHALRRRRRATCLRTHTSPRPDPGDGRRRAADPGPAARAGCFRYEAVDASHASEFFQVEGLMVDEGTTMGDLRGLLDEFAQAMFGPGQADPLPSGLLPVHRAVGRVRRRVPGVRRGRLPGLLADRLDDDPRGRHGPPRRAPVRRPRPGALPGLRLRHGRRADRQPRHGVGDLRLYLENDLRFLEQFR